MNTAMVNIWGVLAGAVAWDERTGVAAFEYDADFKRKNWDLSPLKMPIQSARSVFQFPELRRDSNSAYDTFFNMAVACGIDMMPS